MRAALYTRVACASQQGKQAIVSQLETLREYGASHGMEIIEEFVDEGYSGLRLDRPSLGRMRGLAERRGFDVLLACGPDRLARSFPLQVFIVKELERYGVGAIFPDGTDEALWTLQEITMRAGELEQTIAESDTHGGRGKRGDVNANNL